MLQAILTFMLMLGMVAMKMARLIHSDKEDSWVDICGYGALGAEEKDDK